jgi:hypothetical protein
VPISFRPLAPQQVRVRHDKISRAIRRLTDEDVSRGNFRRAAAAFVDYWGRRGSWDALRPSVQQALTRSAPKAPFDFAALIEEQTPLAAYSRLCSRRSSCGPICSRPNRIIAESLTTLLPAATCNRRWRRPQLRFG